MMNFRVPTWILVLYFLDIYRPILKYKIPKKKGMHDMQLAIARINCEVCHSRDPCPKAN
jgi:hypothetical protein